VIFPGAGERSKTEDEMAKTRTGNPTGSSPILRSIRLGGAALALTCFTGAAALAVPYTHYGFSGTQGLFSVSCSGPGDGGLPHNGLVDNRGFFKPTSVCTSDPLTSSSVSSFASGSVMASSSATAALGTLQGQAAMSTDAQTAVLFPAGFSDLGWIDTLTILDPSSTGQVAMVSVVLNASGALLADGPNVVALLQLIVSSELAGLNLHQPFYQIQSTGPSPQPINDTLVLDLPFIVGTPGQMLVRAQARAMTSSATSFGNNVSDVEFLNTISWGGIADIAVGGISILPDAVVLSASGVDWTGPISAAIPLPPGWSLFLTGLMMLAVARRRARWSSAPGTRSK
jgi:hypothetical protein